MTKLQSRFYLICLIISGILEILAFAGAYGASYFTRTRLGMLRHVVYLNGKWEKTYPIPTIKISVVLLVVIFLLIDFIRYKKIENKNMKDKIVMIMTTLVSIMTLYFLTLYSKDTNRAYYIMSICIALGSVFQNILHHCLLSIRLKSL